VEAIDEVEFLLSYLEFDRRYVAGRFKVWSGHGRERRFQITRVRIPNGIWSSDVFPSLPFEGFAGIPFAGIP
jgi:hypothetical protein